MWSFGFGSNMDRVALETKKHVKIIEESPAILKDWKFSYISGIPHAEPAYANVEVCISCTLLYVTLLSYSYAICQSLCKHELSAVLRIVNHVN